MHGGSRSYISPPASDTPGSPRGGRTVLARVVYFENIYCGWNESVYDLWRESAFPFEGVSARRAITHPPGLRRRAGRGGAPRRARRAAPCARRRRRRRRRRARARKDAKNRHARARGRATRSDGGTISFEPMHRTFITLTRLIHYPVSVSDLYLYTRKTRGKCAHRAARAPRAATYPGPTSCLRSILRLVRRLANGLRHAGRHRMHAQ